MSDTAVEPTPEQAALLADLEAKAQAFLAAMDAASRAGVDVNGYMLRMVSAAFERAGEPMPPMLRMLLG